VGANKIVGWFYVASSIKPALNQKLRVFY